MPEEGPPSWRARRDRSTRWPRQLGRAREAERNFLLSVSHELKTPLTAIRGYTEALADDAVTTEEAV